MRVRKSVSAKTKAVGLTEKNKKRRGRPPGYLTREQLENPSGYVEPAPSQHHLTTLDIIHGTLASTRSKFGAVLAGEADQAAVAREAKRLQRIRRRMAKIEGIDRL